MSTKLDQLQASLGVTALPGRAPTRVIARALRRLQAFFRLPNRRQTLLASLQLRRQLVAARLLAVTRVLLGIDRARSGQQPLNLSLHPRRRKIESWCFPIVSQFGNLGKNEECTFEIIIVFQ